MAPKTITVVDASNNERRKRLSNEDGYRNLLSEFRVAFLKDDDGVEIEDFESLVDGGKYTLGSPQQQKQQHDDHINVSDAVFVLYENTDEGPDPIATAFAVSDSLVMTSAHNVVTRPGAEDDDLNGEEMTDEEEKSERDRGKDLCIDNLMIARLLHKDGNGMITVEGDSFPVALAHYHYFHDWAFLKVCGGGQLSTTIPLATTPEELPQRGTLEKIYIYHCPVKIFRDSRKRTSVHAMPKEASVGTISDKTLSFQNGGFSGSCGGPYVFRNKVVALHVASQSDTVDFEMLDEYEEVSTGRKRKKTMIEKTIEVAESCTSSHTSLGTGIILQARSGIMKIIRSELTVNS